MIDNGSFIFQKGGQQLVEYYLSYFQRAINADQLPGSVILIDPSKRSVKSDSNNTNIKDNLELIGIFHHVYNNYYQIMKIITQIDDDKPFIEENIKIIQHKISSLDTIASFGFDLVRVAFIGGSKAAELALKGGSKVAQLAFGKKERVKELTKKGNQIADEIALKRETDAVEFALRGVEIFGETITMLSYLY